MTVKIWKDHQFKDAYTGSKLLHWMQLGLTRDHVQPSIAKKIGFNHCNIHQWAIKQLVPNQSMIKQLMMKKRLVESMLIKPLIQRHAHRSSSTIRFDPVTLEKPGLQTSIESTILSGKSRLEGFSECSAERVSA